MLKFLLLVVLLLIIPSDSAHILVILTCLKGHTTTLITISTALLKSNQYFLTFVIPESCPDMITSIQNDPNISLSTYQIIYSQIYPHVEQPKTFSVFEFITNLTNEAFTLFPTVHYLLSNLNTDSFHAQNTSTLYPNFNLTTFDNINHGLKTKYNNISALNLSVKIDVVISEVMDIFTPALCKIFNIPLLLRMAPYGPIMLTASLFSKSTLPTFGPTKPEYPFPNYLYKIKNLLNFVPFDLIFVYAAFVHYNPRAKQYGLPWRWSILSDSYQGAVLFNYLGPPFSVLLTPEPYVKQFGFLLNKYQTTNMTKKYMTKLNDWMDLNDIPIILMAMGSSIILEKELILTVYSTFNEICVAQNKCRVIWGLRQIEQLRQDLYPQYDDDNEYIKILQWIPQMDLLYNDKIMLFVNHGGSNSIHEGLYAAKPMIVVPFVTDQPWNAMRVQHLKCAHVIHFNQDDYMDLKKELSGGINEILFKKGSYALYKKNITFIRNMLIDSHGEMDEFVKFVNYVSKYGTKYILNADGLDENGLSWYHKTIVDLCIIFILFFYATFKLIQCVLWFSSICWMRLNTKNNGKQTKMKQN